MKINKDTLRKIAHLARLELEPGKEEAMIKDLNEIISWIEQLQEVDTEGVEPLTNMSQEVNVFRKDKAGKHLEHKRALKNAPDHDEDYFRVPKVLK
jgi:aspartyl-tRNA(Asn)/glutamyl-tRNA(Gln) amidotransferase subunit C